MSCTQSLLFILLYSFPLFRTDNVHHVAPPKDYIPYHKEILAIDSLNASLEFDAALLRYLVLFKRYDRPMVKDAYNACQIAAFTKHPDFKYFFVKCAETGIPLNFMLSHQIVFKNYSIDSMKLKNLFLDGRSTYLKRIDIPLQQEMKLRHQKEQKAKSSAAYSSVCQENFSRILELSKQNRFPGEALIGTSDDLENVVVPTLCHYPYAYKHLDQYLNKAVVEGSLAPVMAMYIYGFSQTRTSVLYTEAIPTDNASFTTCYNLPFGKQSNDIIKVDQNRAIKWIPSVSIQKQIKSELPKRGIDYQFGY